jgi:hypothetical protein
MLEINSSSDTALHANAKCYDAVSAKSSIEGTILEQMPIYFSDAYSDTISILLADLNDISKFDSLDYHSERYFAMSQCVLSRKNKKDYKIQRNLKSYIFI